MDIRKFGIAIAIAILTAILIYSIADAVAPPVDYNTCYSALAKGPDPVRAEQSACTDAVIDEAAQKTCVDQKYAYEPVYGSSGCIEKYQCNDCYELQRVAQEKRNMMIFYVAIALGLAAIVLGFLLPLGSIHEWVGLGFIIGGVIGLFIGTVQYWSDLSRIVRPIVIFIELLVVLFIVYRKLAVKTDGESDAEAPVTKNMAAPISKPSGRSKAPRVQKR